MTGFARDAALILLSLVLFVLCTLAFGTAGFWLGFAIVVFVCFARMAQIERDS